MGRTEKKFGNRKCPTSRKPYARFVGRGKKYLVSTEEEEIICYDVYTGKMLWQQKYKDIDQDDYLGCDELRDGVMIQYDG